MGMGVPARLPKERKRAKQYPDLALSSFLSFVDGSFSEEQAKEPSEERMPPYAGEAPGRRRPFLLKDGVPKGPCLSTLDVQLRNEARPLRGATRG